MNSNIGIGHMKPDLAQTNLIWTYIFYEKILCYIIHKNSCKIENKVSN